MGNEWNDSHWKEHIFTHFTRKCRFWMEKRCIYIPVQSLYSQNEQIHFRWTQKPQLTLNIHAWLLLLSTSMHIFMFFDFDGSLRLQIRKDKFSWTNFRIWKAKWKFKMYTTYLSNIVVRDLSVEDDTERYFLAFVWIFAFSFENITFHSEYYVKCLENCINLKFKSRASTYHFSLSLEDI